MAQLPARSQATAVMAYPRPHWAVPLRAAGLARGPGRGRLRCMQKLRVRIAVGLPIARGPNLASWHRSILRGTCLLRCIAV